MSNNYDEETILNFVDDDSAYHEIFDGVNEVWNTNNNKAIDELCKCLGKAISPKIKPYSDEKHNPKITIETKNGKKQVMLTVIVHKYNFTWNHLIRIMSLGICPIKFPEKPFVWRCKPTINPTDNFECSFQLTPSTKGTPKLGVFKTFLKDVNDNSPVSTIYWNEQNTTDFNSLENPDAIIFPNVEVSEATNYPDFYNFLENAPLHVKGALWYNLASALDGHFANNHTYYPIYLSNNNNYNSLFFNLRLKASEDFGYSDSIFENISAEIRAEMAAFDAQFDDDDDDTIAFYKDMGDAASDLGMDKSKNM